MQDRFEMMKIERPKATKKKKEKNTPKKQIQKLENKPCHREGKEVERGHKPDKNAIMRMKNMLQMVEVYFVKKIDPSGHSN